MTPHIEASKDKIAKKVIMPGDPLRAKFIAEKYLTNCEVVSKIRGNYVYTGFYKETLVTVMASGMGMSSMGIYAYELYKFYDVDEIIRIGSAGAYEKTLNLFDIVLTKQSYNEGAYAYTYNNEECHLIKSDEQLNQKIKQQAEKLKLPIIIGNTLCSEVFEPYMPNADVFKNRLPKELNIINSEMESFSLFYIARLLNKKAACLTTISDNPYTNENMTSKQREVGFEQMIKLALEAIL